MMLELLAILMAAAGVYAQSTYRAAVVEFSVDQLSMQRVTNNLIDFRNTLDQIRKLGGANIVIFPEDAIIGEFFMSRESVFPYLERIPEISGSNEQTNPCTQSDFNDRPILRNLSCLAREFSTILVANMGDVQTCEGMQRCPSDGRYQFNTNVIFEADGTLITKYHKINLYDGEKDYFDAGDPSECVTFDTSFGVMFGAFTCFDLLYNEPGNCLLKKGVKNFVLPTSWGNNFPFYVSIGVQQSWSFKHSVNFLAANQQYSITIPSVEFYSSGSGIYSSGYAQYFLSSFSLSRSVGHVIISELPKNPGPAGFQQSGTVLNANNIQTKGSEYLAFKPLQNHNGVIKVSMTESEKIKRSLLCTLEYSIASAGNKELYALGVYIGVRLDDDSFGYAVCSVVRCSTTNLDSCGDPVDGYIANTVFENLRLNGTFPATSDVYATAFQSDLRLLNPSDIKIGKNNLTISGYTQPLLSANLWARVNTMRSSI